MNIRKKPYETTYIKKKETWACTTIYWRKEQMLTSKKKKKKQAQDVCSFINFWKLLCHTTVV